MKTPPGLDGVAVNVALSPSQITLLDKVTVGNVFTTTVPVAVATQPFKSYKTLYVEVVEGLTDIDELVLEP